MPFEIDRAGWTGEGTFTQVLIERLGEVEGVRFLFVGFATIDRQEPIRRFGLFPGSRTVTVKAMTIADLEAALTAMPDVGAPDYGDQGMLQYLRSERIVPPYQTRGYKLVELVRIYEIGTPRRS
jgi:hypothetical protein